VPDPYGRPEDEPPELDEPELPEPVLPEPALPEPVPPEVLGEVVPWAAEATADVEGQTSWPIPTPAAAATTIKRALAP
jgi:hypothetical protein